MLLLILLAVLLILVVIFIVMRNRGQNSNVVTKSDVPPPGVYTFKDSILGNSIDLSVTIVQNASSATSGTFTFDMNSPSQIHCSTGNFWSASTGTDLSLTLSDCLVQALESNDIILSSISYSSTTKIVTGKILYKKVVPISLDMKQISTM